MAEQQLIDYIRTSQQSGISSDTIKEGLLSAGWNQGQIDEAYQAINIPKLPIPSAPSPAERSTITRKRYTSPYSAMLALVLVLSLLILAQNAVTDILDRFAPNKEAFNNSQEYADYMKAYQQRIADSERQMPKQANYQNPEDYSKAYSEWYRLRYPGADLLYNQYYSQYELKVASPSFRMILNAIVVLPFWIITFLIFISLKEERKKYGVLLGSYYITSGWLLIFLFFNVAKYIWYSDTVLGVYIVFGMLAIILTGAVWAVQKYRHNIEN